MNLEINKIYNEDCLAGMKNIPDKSIDLILQDPPYNTTACKWEWDIMEKIDDFWLEWKRIIKDNGAIVMTASQPFTSKLVMSNLKMFKYEWIWEKTMPNNYAQAKYQAMKYHENILIFGKNKTIFNPIMERRSDVGIDRLKKCGRLLCVSNVTSEFMAFKREKGVYREYDKQKVYPKSVQKIGSVPNCNGTKLHPTQKPVALFEYLIKTYTNENETVFDGFMGSGTTAIACINTKRNYIGFELDKKYFDVAEKRISEHKKQEEFNFGGEL